LGLPTLCLPPLQMVYGGRGEDGYYKEKIWVLDIQSGKWREEEQKGSCTPQGRDHHSVALYKDKMFVWGESWLVMHVLRTGRAPWYACGLLAGP
jgi:hypothetical protein